MVGEGSLSAKDNTLRAELPDTSRVLRLLNPQDAVTHANAVYQPLNGPIAWSSKIDIDFDAVEAMMLKQERLYKNQKAEYGDMAEIWDVIQNAMNWLVVYDPEKDRAVTPVARPWAYGWGGREPGGYILFCWDNFFASYMHAIESKELAYNEAVQMCREIKKLGFVPNFAAPGGLKSRDRSQPPVGSLMVMGVYNRYGEDWFLETVFDDLLTWNRWWSENRDHDGYLCWGSNPFDPVAGDKREGVQNEFKAASNESGLDNTPMYDEVPFDTTEHLLEMADVGLMGLYIADCKVLAHMADILERPKAKQELTERAGRYENKLKTLWDDEFGMFLNKRTDTGELSRRISPTNLYPLIAGAATREQAERMVQEHFYNPDEFWGEWILPSIARNDTGYTGRDYWRGSIWAPMNFLVYLGFQNYDLPQARADLAEKSKALLLKQWREERNVRENYHAETGGDPGARSNPFYHWGALLGMINLIEHGQVGSPMQVFD
ncbi:MAG: trehalase family glycosidase [candidate division KSB1 bacterium]|nr:trehalase family glycosidase [candidate division KSB1 bacterium]